MTKAKAPLGVKWFVEAPNLGLKGMAQKIGTKLGNIVWLPVHDLHFFRHWGDEKGITKINATLCVRMGIIIAELGLAPLIVRERQFLMHTPKK